MYKQYNSMHFPYLIFYFFIDIGFNSIKIKLLKLNPLVKPSIDCKFKSFKLVIQYPNRLLLLQETGPNFQLKLSVGIGDCDCTKILDHLNDHC